MFLKKDEYLFVSTFSHTKVPPHFVSLRLTLVPLRWFWWRLTSVCNVMKSEKQPKLDRWDRTRTGLVDPDLSTLTVFVRRSTVVLLLRRNLSSSGYWRLFRRPANVVLRLPSGPAACLCDITADSAVMHSGVLCTVQPFLYSPNCVNIIFL